MLQNKRVSIGRLGTAVCYNEIMRRERQTTAVTAFWELTNLRKIVTDRRLSQSSNAHLPIEVAFPIVTEWPAKRSLGSSEMRNHRPIQFDSGDGTIVNVLLVDVEGFCSKKARAVVHIMGIYNKRVWVFVRAGADERRSRKGIVLIKIAMKIIFRILYMRIGWRKRHGHSQTGYPVFS